MSVAIVNIGDSHRGDLTGSRISGDALVCEDDRISWIGDSGEVGRADHETVIDANEAALVPGFIDSHVHITFGDYTPRQRTVGFLESYLHGGMTRAISASEVHVPGRPNDVTGVKALAIAAERCFRDYRPGGVAVHAGSVILEPELTAEDFSELREAGVWLAKAGFGAFETPMDYVPVVRAAQEAGLIVMSHTGGGSIPGSQSKIDAETLLAMRPNIAGHVNGGPTALEPEENARMVEEGEGIALQLAQAGNLRSAINIAKHVLEADCLERLLISTDTPTGTGMVPLGLLHLMAELASLGPLSGRQTIAAVTGSVAEIYGLDVGKIEPGKPADLLLIDAPVGSAAREAVQALETGDVPAVAVAITAGVVRFTKSRNTPVPQRSVSVRSGRKSSDIVSR
jgi:enamidase